MQQLKKLKLDAERPAGTLSASEHAQKVERLQREKFNLTKEIGDIERETDYASGELGKLREEHSKLQARDIPSETAIDATAYVSFSSGRLSKNTTQHATTNQFSIQLSIMRSLGTDLISPGRALVRK